ncbi:MAG: hypothetical protein JO138_21965 [Acidobacteriaceae bacterium]|nr:hypothetical protein [Acidobacteriaceae bacterium]
MENVIIVLSADHGVAPVPDPHQRMPGGYLSAHLESVVSSALNQQFGKADWLVPGTGGEGLYFNREAIESAKHRDGTRASEDEIYRVAQTAILAAPQLHVARVYSRLQLDNGIAGDFIASAEMNGYFPRRSGDLSIVLESGYIPGNSGTTHFSPYAYDRHVPVLFMGPRIRPGRYDVSIKPNDIAPTVATMLDIQTPSGSSGRVLTEMLTR